LAPARFGLFPLRSPLLRESRLLSFPQGTEMFQFPWFPLPALCVQTGVTPHDGCRVSPFGHPRINARSTASRGFSQSPTSFIGSRRQGIHRWLFVAWKNKFFTETAWEAVSKDARARSAILKGRRKSTGAAEARGLRRCRWLPQNGREDAGPEFEPATGELNLDRRRPRGTGPPVHQLGVPHRSPAEIGRRRGDTP
jgi:hypothetical protein